MNADQSHGRGVQPRRRLGRAQPPSLVSRRRVIRIVGAALGLAVVPRVASAACAPAANAPRTWHGIALGADASLSLYHSDPREADRIIAACVSEVRRLETVFSLYDNRSALSRLNQAGHLNAPPGELVALLSQSQRVGARTNGAFDVTVQPLWRLFAEHFSRPNADPAGPSGRARAVARGLVDFRAMDVTSDRIQFHNPGMAVTLNGIAQGFVTDRITALLKARGIDRVLVDMGELRGLGRHPDGRPWRVGIVDPLSPRKFSRVIDVADQAVASSGGYGTRFGPNGRHHHLFDPKTGGSACDHAGVTVRAPTATLADALSTAFSVLPTSGVQEVIGGYRGITATVTEPDRRVLTFTA